MSQRRNFESASDTDSGNGGAECLPQAKRLLLDKCYTPRKAPSSISRHNTPASSRRPNTATRIPNYQNSIQSATSSSNNKLRIVKTSDPIEVYCRVRPWGSSDEDRCLKIINEKQVVLTPPETSSAWKCGVAKEMTYSFQQVFGPEVDQTTLFQTVALPLIEDVLRGKSALLFAYGVTGSGKTFTMSGTPNESGIMPRALDVIFNSISKVQAIKYVFKSDRMNGFDIQTQADAMLDLQKELTATAKTPRSRPGHPRIAQLAATPSDSIENLNRISKDTTVLPVVNDDFRYAVFVTYVEMYNNNVYDLLDDSYDERTKKINLQSKILREGANRNIYVSNCTELEVSSAEEAFEVFLRGQRRRKQAETCLNSESSRSHAVFNVRIVQAPLDQNGEEVLDNKNCMVISHLSLVDLAGSERYGRTGATGSRLKEAASINNSLMTLRKCMDVLRENQKTGKDNQVPYREAKLMYYLKNFFEGESRVRMILCVNPRNEDYDENIHVMTFAELTQEVQVVRPQERKPDPLTPGRKKANEIFKEARRRIVRDINIDESEIPTDVNMVFGLGPPLPNCHMTKSDEEELIINLRKALEMRIKGRAELSKILTEKRHNFRIKLVDVERDIETIRADNASLRLKVERLCQDKEAVENLLQTVQYEKSEQEIRADEFEKENIRLSEELETLKMKLRQSEVTHHKDKQKLQQDLRIQEELNERKAERELKRKEAKLKATYQQRDKTLEAVRELVQSADLETRRSRSRRSRSLSDSYSTATSSDSDLPVASSSQQTPLTTRSRVISAPLLPADRSPQKSRSGGVAVANPRHYRARSTDRDVWIEHVPGQPVKSGTVFQPVMKKKKSVNKLTNADEVISKNKYCLHLQETDGEGGIETKLFKGDIIPSSCGGAQVILNDVETLTQRSPTSISPLKRTIRNSPANVNGSPTRKRTSTSVLHSYGGTPHRGDFNCDEVDIDTIAERCATGIGHQDSGFAKRSRQN